MSVLETLCRSSANVIDVWSKMEYVGATDAVIVRGRWDDGTIGPSSINGRGGPDEIPVKGMIKEAAAIGAATSAAEAAAEAAADGVKLPMIMLSKRELSGWFRNS